MGIYDFRNKTTHEQYDIIFTQGQFIDTVTSNDIKYALYAVSMFWVEVEYHAPSNKILKCTPFVSGDKLNKYSNIPKSF